MENFEEYWVDAVRHRKLSGIPWCDDKTFAKAVWKAALEWIIKESRIDVEHGSAALNFCVIMNSIEEELNE